MRRFLCMLVILAMAFPAAVPAFAEEDAGLTPDATLLRLEVRIRDKLYNCTTTIDGLTEQGLSFVDEGREPGRYHQVTTGRDAFYVVLEAADRETATEADTYACGFRLTAKDNSGAVIPGGLELGKATRKDVQAVYGESPSGSSSSLSYYWYWNYVHMYYYFTEDGDDAPIDSVEFTSAIPYSYGTEVSGLAGVDADNLPDPKSFNYNQFILDGKFYDGSVTLQQLLDNGWKISAEEADTTLNAQGTSHFLISGAELNLFNGRSFMHAFVYNSAEEGTCTPAEGTVLQVFTCTWDGGTDIIVADGIRLNSTFDELTAAYGTNYEETAGDGYTDYTYTVGNVQNTFRVADGLVIRITVRP